MAKRTDRAAEVKQRTDALVARADAIRRTVAAAADELAGLTRELRALLAEDGGDHASR